MGKIIHKLLYRTLSLKAYLRTVSRLFFLFHRLGIGRYAPATEYVYHLPELVGRGDTAIDIGANLGYYSRPIAQLIGREGHLYSVEPVPEIFEVLQYNMRRHKFVRLLPYALGCENKTISMGNDSAPQCGYFGTGQNFVKDSDEPTDVSFTAQMRRGSELFSDLERLDFVKCDIEGYEWIVMSELRALIERFHPTVLIETGGENRPKIIHLFEIMGYEGFTLEHGEERPLTSESEKDIIFRYKD